MTCHRLVKMNARLRSAPDPLLLAAGFVAVVAIAGLQLAVGGGLLVLDLLLVPLAAVAWFTRSSRHAYCLAFAAAAVTMAASLALGLSGDAPAALAAGAVRLAVYCGATAALVHVRRMQAECDSVAHTDHLTGVANVRAFHALAEGELERGRRYGRELSLLYFDIDDFKAVNDQLGHAEGDRVLRQVGVTLRGVVRGVDLAARLGGDEFVVLMPETDTGAACALADRLRQALAGVLVADGRPLTASMGLATFAVPPSSVARLLRIGDGLMYSAKTQGKNAVARATLRAAPEPCPPTPSSGLTLPEVFAEQFGHARPAASETTRGRRTAGT